MARTAPAPNIPPIPGMCPGVLVLAGGDESGGSGDGSANDGKGKVSSDPSSDKKDPSADNKDAPDPAKYPTCGTESHPVDVVTGRVFTHPYYDLILPGPIPFTFDRSWSSSAVKQDQGLGLGWGHSLGWFLDVTPRRVTVWTDRGVAVHFPMIGVGHEVIGDWGWVLRRDGAGGFSVDAMDGVWRVFTKTDETGRRCRLTSIEDSNRNRIAITYDAVGSLAQVTDSAGRVIKFTPTAQGRIASIEVRNAEPSGQWVAFARYFYDDDGRLVRVTDADDYSWTYEYDELDRMTRDTDRVGLSFCFRYDAEDRGIEAWGEYAGKRDPSLADDVPKLLADGSTRAKGIYHRKFVYAPGYTEVTDTTEHRRYFGNAKGTLDKAVTGGAVTTSRYDKRGFEIEKTDPVGATWKWVRDERGRVLESIDPLGNKTQFERDSQGLAVQIVDPAGGVSRVHRDARGNFELFTDATGASTQVVTDERGLFKSVTDPAGATTKYTHDAHGNLISIVQANGATWAFAYDALGRKVAVRNPGGAESRYSYSNRGDLLAVQTPDGGVTRYSYDGERHVTQIISPSGAATDIVWGGFHKVCGRRDANGNVVRLAYSREGELVAIHNERGELHRFEYDNAGVLVGEETFDGRKLRYRNDAAGRVVRVENGAGQSRVLAYDLAGHLIERTLPDETTDTFEYDARGELKVARNAAGEFRFERDAVGRIVREMQKVGGVEHWVAVTFDLAGNRVGRETSLGLNEQIQRDVMGVRVQTVLDGEHRVQHANDIFSREVERKLPGGGIIESGFDAMGRLTQRTARCPIGGRPMGVDEPEWLGKRDDGVTASSSYQYDAENELIGKHDRKRGHTRYEYDPVGQLLAAVPERARKEVFRYDATGNSYTTDGPERAYGKGNRLLREGNTDYEWDDDGRLIRKTERAAEGDRVWTYVWNGAGLLERVETPEGKSVEFAYDPFARRVEKRVRERVGMSWRTASQTRFVWDGEVLAHDVKKAASASGDPIVEVKSYVFDDYSFEPRAHRDGAPGDATAPQWFHYVNDASGAPDEIIDERGQVACSLDKTAWGETTESPGAKTSTQVRFQGQYEDEETSLYYNRARYYAPGAGRYISADPLGSEAGLNHFTYGVNPLAWADPDGLSKADTVLLGRFMETRVLPAAKVLDAHTYDPSKKAKDRFNAATPAEKADPNSAVNKAAHKNQKQWMRDMIKSGRRICDIGTPTGAPPSAFCADEHAVLKKAGFKPVPAGNVTFEHPPGSGTMHTEPMVEWKKP